MDLAAINAAIKLGDPVFPPLRTVVVVTDWPGRGMQGPVKGWVAKWPGKRTPRRFHVRSDEQRMFYRAFEPGRVSYTIIALPDDAPPFEKWTRL